MWRMMINPIRFKKIIARLPANPGVYLMKDQRGRVIYVGKAASLRSRVASYWVAQEARSRPHIQDLIRAVTSVGCIETGSVIEALILEANLIKTYKPKYNIMQKDDKSFLYLAITRDRFPRPLLVRGNELSQIGYLPAGKAGRHYKKVFGPYTSPSALRAALGLIRRVFPWSTCLPPKHVFARPEAEAISRSLRSAREDKKEKPCFDYHLGLCPGVCVGAVSRSDYAKTIRGLILFFQGKKSQILRGLKKQMKDSSRAERFEEAAVARKRIFALEHIQDVAVLTREESPFFRSVIPSTLQTDEGSRPINIFGRIEGYDISNISGTSAVGSLVVFQDGEPKKSEYRKFRIKTVRGANDFAMLQEVLRRRFQNQWPHPDFILIDGDWGQVNVARQILAEKKLRIPVVGIAKGFDRKQDRLVYPKENLELARITEQYKTLLQRVRDEAHRFAVVYHRKIRSNR